MMEGVFKFSTWDMEDVGVFHEKGVSIVSLHAFQPFNSPLEMPITIKVNMPILTSNHIFPNRKGFKMLEKFVPKRKSISEKIPNFQDSQKEDVQVVSPFQTQKNNSGKRLRSKKSWSRLKKVRRMEMENFFLN
jgi:hypothetical protein